MNKLTQNRLPTPIQNLTAHVHTTIQRFLHMSVMSGVILIIAAGAALIWANSSYNLSYENFWHTPLSIGFGPYIISWDLRFWINDVLMTIFFCCVGMEIRHEIHEGALSSFKQASLPIIAAFGGVIMPAIIYLLFNLEPIRQQGWAIPTATDIAFAVGVLALLGKSIPLNIRIILLSLAIIDDIIAVLVIAFFYSSNLDISGLSFAFLALALIFLMQWIGIKNAWFYCIPGGILWFGLYKTGIHPSLAGVILGMLAPVLPSPSRVAPLKNVQEATQKLQQISETNNADDNAFIGALKELHASQQQILAPVVRVQMALSPWVSFGIMPLFAFANAGITFRGIDLHLEGASFIAIGIVLALLIGKPLGIFLAAFIAVKCGISRLPPHVNWSGILLVGLLAGIGFTMAIFIAMLAFDDPNQLSTAKMAVLLGSLLSAIIGLVYGFCYSRHLKIKQQP